MYVIMYVYIYIYIYIYTRVILGYMQYVILNAMRSLYNLIARPVGNRSPRRQY